MSPYRKIAVFLPNWVGDVVMATPALRAIRRHFADAHIVGVLRPYVAGVLEGTGWLDQQIALNPRGSRRERWSSVAARLRREDIDLAILFPNSFHSALVAWRGRCCRRVGYNRYLRGMLLTDRLPAITDQRGRLVPSPIIDAYNRLAQHIGCPTPGRRMELATTEADEVAADLVWHQAGFYSRGEVVALNPGAAFGSAKHWPTESFSLLAQMLVDQRESGVLVLCGPGEQNMAREITRRADRAGVFALADQPLSLGLTKACVRRASLLITTDSGPRHFAAAFDRPVVTLFGPTHIAWTDTFYAKAIHMQRPVNCGPCQLRTCPLDHRCMKELTPDAVFAEATRLLRDEMANHRESRQAG